MSHCASQVAVLIENNAVRARAFATIKLGSISHDGKFQVGWCDSEWKAFVIILSVRIIVAPDSLAILVVAAARVHRIVDVILGVTVVTANGSIGLACEDIRGLGKGRGQDSCAEEA